MARETILTETVFDFMDSGDGLYLWDGDLSTSFESGETYYVIWDDVEYSCVASASDGTTTLGNLAISNLGEDTEEPFLISLTSEDATIATTDTATSHTMVIYQYFSNGIVIKNPLGKSITYGEYSKVLVNRANGEKTIYSEGDAEEISIELDFSEGDMSVKPENGKLWSKVDISIPKDLVPENIAKGAEIAGISGTFEGGGGVGDMNSLKYTLYQIDEENKEIIIYMILWSQLYADTKSYDISIPDAVGSYQVVIVSEGVS